VRQGVLHGITALPIQWIHYVIFFQKGCRALPLYAYRCTQCGHRFEKIQSFSSKQERVCPVCQGVLERPLTAPAFKFKGAGWYVNDYAGKSAPTSEPSNSATPAETKAPTAATESKPSGSAAPAAAPASKTDSTAA
jgi:putative FmdB family regulatory protein